MNLIVCDENCRHQQEGYCTLNQITRLTKDTRAKCGYYEDVDDSLKMETNGPDLTSSKGS